MKHPAFPASTFLLIALALCLVAVVPRAYAGAVYRCKGTSGETAITNKPQGFSDCTKIADYVDPPKAAVAKPAAAKPVTAKPDDSVKVEKDLPAVVAPLPGNSVRSEYKSEPASQFADVSGGVSVNGVKQKPGPMQNATEKLDKSTEIRRGAVYKVSRANGITEYTNVRPSEGQYRTLFTYIATCFACDVHSAINFTTLALNMTAYRDEIAAASTEFGVEQALLRAVIHAESAFNPNAVSNKGAQGLMQLMPTTAADLGVASPFDALQNIRGGAHYLAMLLKQFNGDERLAAAAYNSGPQNVQKYSGVPPFDETRVYVERVATLRKRYSEAQ